MLSDDKLYKMKEMLPNGYDYWVKTYMSCCHRQNIVIGMRAQVCKMVNVDFRTQNNFSLQKAIFHVPFLLTFFMRMQMLAREVLASVKHTFGVFALMIMW